MLTPQSAFQCANNIHVLGGNPPRVYHVPGQHTAHGAARVVVWTAVPDEGGPAACAPGRVPQHCRNRDSSSQGTQCRVLRRRPPYLPGRRPLAERPRPTRQAVTGMSCASGRCAAVHKPVFVAVLQVVRQAVWALVVRH